MIGAGHVGYHLGRLAHTIGFRTHVLDDREKFANRERFPDADDITVDTIPDWLHRAEIPSSAYVVVVTRGHTHDLDAMRALAARDLRYLGLIGSKAKVKRISDALLAEGMPPECLQRARAGRSRHRRRQPRGDRGGDPGRADRRAARQDPRSQSGGGVDALARQRAQGATTATYGIISTRDG